MKRFITILSFATCMLILTLSGSAQENNQGSNYKISARPKVGLVLGGGGAKGAAHIGVLKYIEEMGIPVDYISGTSMGSIIGGLYALGYTPQELDELISGMNWSMYMSNNINRDMLSSSEKVRKSTTLVSIPFNTATLNSKLSFNKSETSLFDEQSFLSSLPSSVIRGSSLLNLFSSLCIGYLDSIDFNQLPIPFACVATDVRYGTELDIHSGQLPIAIRASMAIPGVFEPIRMGDHILMDGGMMNNFPADVCYGMGANIIIGVEVSDGLIEDSEDLRSLPQLASQLMNIAVMGKKEENRKLCNILVRPDITGYDMLSFDNTSIDTLIKRGYKEAQKHHDEFVKIKQYLDQWNAPGKTLQAKKAKSLVNDSVYLHSITMNCSTDNESDWLLRKGRLSVGKTITVLDIKHAVDIYMGTGAYSNISYRLKEVKLNDSVTDANKYDLIMDFEPSEPHIMSAGFRFDSEENASMLLSLGYNQERMAGWMFRLDAKLSTNPWFEAVATWGGRSLANFNLAYTFNRADFNLLHNDTTYSNINNSYSSRIKLYISEFHLRKFAAEGGFEVEELYYHLLPTNHNEFPGFVNNTTTCTSYGPFAKLTFDNMDDAYFAHDGLRATLETHWRNDHNPKIPRDSRANFADVSFTLQDYITPWSDNLTIIPQIYSRLLMGKTYSFTYHNLVGGDILGRYYDFQMPFIGTNSPALCEELCTILRCDIRYNLFGKHYLTAMVNYLHAADYLSEYASYKDADNFIGVGLKYSINTLIGPVAFDVHWSDLTNSFGTYLSLGYTF